ncbi:hypothetical protein [Phormidium sp. CCY1219]|uniref:hypothetical protein n=1 Tax=Phormidium sp. CCY1219 TaxID=2886104 RepID=UPI002D1F7C25|nr:hypothetical protein [Phormidium sp. CCY1219]MEB3829791.1 hypothetical protein [Phormidium sp. CCY1219]
MSDLAISYLAFYVQKTKKTVQDIIADVKKNDNNLGKSPKETPKPYWIELSITHLRTIEGLFSTINNENLSDCVTAGVYLLHKQLVEDIPNSQSGESQNQTDE